MVIRAGGINKTPFVPVQSREGINVMGSLAASNTKSISDGTRLGKSLAIDRIRDELGSNSKTIRLTAAL